MLIGRHAGEVLWTTGKVAPAGLLSFTLIGLQPTHPTECGCSGLLVDTWSKHKRSPLVANSEWSTRLSRVRDAGLLLVLAGGLDETRFEDLAPLQPDLFAVRGGACQAGRRDAKIDPTRVESLAKAASRLT